MMINSLDKARPFSCAPLLLRMAKHLFYKTKKHDHVLDSQGLWVKIPEFKQGVRPMTAIVEMSMLSGRKSFEQASQRHLNS